MKVILSPAKNISEDEAIKNDYSIPIFENEALLLINKLKKLKVDEIINLMSISTDLAQLNHWRFNNWSKANSIENGKYIQAIHAFSGEVYRGFEIHTLEEKNVNVVHNSVRILSGLYGILKPYDLISPYRLEMGTKFNPTSNGKNLYEFWCNKVTDLLLNELLLDEPVFNLASVEYSKVINFKRINNPVITPIFKEFKGGKYSVVMMYAKNARGKMARYLVENSELHLEKLKLFNQDGYSFDDKLSTEKEWIFVR
jgi:cytoplasmic iron level regulating protein YaaA (DUF328/UPF0246 family)